MKKIILFLIFFVSVKVYSDSTEYQLLWEDLSNARTPGYKTRFNRDLSKGTLTLYRIIQSSLIKSDESHHFAIQGDGFFKVILQEINSIGYTRNGQFSIVCDLKDNYKMENQRLVLTQARKYELADCITYYIARAKKNNDGKVEIFEIFQSDDIIGNYSRTVEGETEFSELYGPTIAKQLKIYDVPYDKLRHYKDGVYLLDSNYTDEIEEQPYSRVISNALELSNVPLIPVLARMYYLALTDDAMRNHAFKADLLKTILNNSSISDYAANMTNDRITDYIQELLPFLRYNY